jgi:YecR-like lipoprotein
MVYKYLALALLVAGCTVQTAAVPIGGSRADGTVELAYEFGDLQTAEVDWAAAQQQATQRCASWGYTAAEKFGGERRQCSMPSGYGCLRWQVTVPYQCTGGKPVVQTQ